MHSYFKCLLPVLNTHSNLASTTALQPSACISPYIIPSLHTTLFVRSGRAFKIALGYDQRLVGPNFLSWENGLGGNFLSCEKRLGGQLQIAFPNPYSKLLSKPLGTILQTALQTALKLLSKLSCKLPSKLLFKLPSKML